MVTWRGRIKGFKYQDQVLGSCCRRWHRTLRTADRCASRAAIRSSARLDGRYWNGILIVLLQPEGMKIERALPAMMIDCRRGPLYGDTVSDEPFEYEDSLRLGDLVTVRE
jgi:hypothetical protein